jgi:hypothetical protein
LVSTASNTPIQSPFSSAPSPSRSSPRLVVMATSQRGRLSDVPVTFCSGVDSLQWR